MIRLANNEDFKYIWPIFKEVVKAGETYAYAPDANEEQAFHIWMEAPVATFVYEDNGQILGTYYLKTNQAGPGQHVCNCGYMVSSLARGKGVATKMCQHSLTQARQLNYQAMQFNFVASTNEQAIYLWHKLGFETVGRLPKAFKHPTQGYVDALVMYQWLAEA